MTRWRYLLFALYTAAIQPAWAQGQALKADIVVTGAPIYTVDASRTWAQAMAVKDGKIVFVGDELGAKKYAGAGTQYVQLSGGMILPGFHDCHVHPAESGIELGRCTLDNCDSRELVLERIAQYVKEHQSESWIVGSGWSLPLFPDANPVKEDLDAIIPDRPACFISQDGHSAWANSKALKLAGLDQSTADPPLGKIERDAQGRPSGTLRESAVELVSNLQPKPTVEERECGLLKALDMANSFGITSMQDANVTEPYLQTYSSLEKAGKLTSRIVAALHVDPDKDVQQVEQLCRLRRQYSSALVKPTSAKIFADGVIESHTAALLQPYSDKPETAGVLNFPPQKMQSIVEVLDKNGFQVHVHAIGDRAVNVALNAFEHALSVNGYHDNRHQIAHLELIQPSDLPRFRKLGVIANFQSFWAFNDPYISKCTAPLIGPERSGRLYQLRSVFNTGAVIAAGSDWSVSSMNPLDAIQVAVTRLGLDDTSTAAWIPSERINLPEIVAAYTINGAYDNHNEKLCGSLESGKYADFIVLDKNIFDVPFSAIHNVHVQMTYLGGKLVYRCPR